MRSTSYANKDTTSFFRSLEQNIHNQNSTSFNKLVGISTPKSSRIAEDDTAIQLGLVGFR
jgi:CxxC motif-containing protein (DUF1111 family)